MEAIHHRGPDADGIYIDTNASVFLGHKRLAILDIAGGTQPMWDQDKRYCVIFNGEIYNHRALRRNLEDLGHRFQTENSDTEVLIHGYIAWGDALARKLNGMFAFAIYDTVKRELFLARDRMGEKPLYYSILPDRSFVFGSELKAVLSHEEVSTSYNISSVQKFFGWGYLPGEASMIDGVFKLPPGHHARYTLTTGAFKTTPYWQFSLKPEDDAKTEDELCDELEQILRDSVQRRLMSDVPIGVFLSGGVDSSVILAALAEIDESNQHSTFTIGFHEPSFDESIYAQQVADQFQSNHHTFLLGIDEAKDVIPKVLAGIDEPLGDASLLPTYLVSKFAAEHVKVALTGDGGDELFAGYDPFDALGPAKMFRAIVPSLAYKGLRNLVDMLPNSTKYEL